MKKLILPTILVFLAAASTAGPPLNIWIDFEFPVQTAFCFGEDVIASGRAHILADQGDAPDRFHVNAQGIAVGTITGNTWLWRDHINITCNEECFGDDDWTGTQTETVLLVGPGHLPDGIFKIRLHATVRDGEPKVFFSGEDVKCK